MSVANKFLIKMPYFTFHILAQKISCHRYRRTATCPFLMQSDVKKREEEENEREREYSQPWPMNVSHSEYVMKNTYNVAAYWNALGRFYQCKSSPLNTWALNFYQKWVALSKRSESYTTWMAIKINCRCHEKSCFFFVSKSDRGNMKILPYRMSRETIWIQIRSCRNNPQLRENQITARISGEHSNCKFTL